MGQDGGRGHAGVHAPPPAPQGRQDTPQRTSVGQAPSPSVGTLCAPVLGGASPRPLGGDSKCCPAGAGVTCSAEKVPQCPGENADVCRGHRPGKERQSDRETASQPPAEGTRGSGAGFLALYERLCSAGPLPAHRQQACGLREGRRGGMPTAEAEELLGLHVHFPGHTRRWAPPT